MSLHRVVLAGLAAVFTVSMTSLASAGGWGWGAGWGSGWGGGWGAGFGCGTCGAPSAAVIYAQPVAPPPPPPPLPVVARGCGCHAAIFAPPPAPVIAPLPIAPAPIYVVNQGPYYEGPGITVPYHTWRPTPGYGPAAGYHWPHYGYGPRWGFRYGYRYGARPWAYGAHLTYGRPYHRWPMPLGHSYPWNK